MSCLYRSDYGPAMPGFDPLAGNGAQIAGYESHARELATAQNPGQLAAMKRAFDRGETVQWCDQGYGWTYDPHLAMFFGIVLVVFVLPYLLLRFIPSLRRGPARRNFHIFD